MDLTERAHLITDYTIDLRKQVNQLIFDLRANARVVRSNTHRENVKKKIYGKNTQNDTKQQFDLSQKEVEKSHLRKELRMARFKQEMAKLRKSSLRSTNVLIESGRALAKLECRKQPDPNRFAMSSKMSNRSSETCKHRKDQFRSQTVRLKRCTSKRSTQRRLRNAKKDSITLKSYLQSQKQQIQSSRRQLNRTQKKNEQLFKRHSRKMQALKPEIRSYRKQQLIHNTNSAVRLAGKSDDRAVILKNSL